MTVMTRSFLIMLLVAGLILPLASGGRPVSAQSRDFSRVRVLAIAPFADDNPLSRPLAEHGAARLSELLKGGRFQIIESARVAGEMTRLSVTPPDLISPTRTVALGTQLGADAVLTGRVVQIFQEFRRERSESSFSVSIEGRVIIDVRVLEVGTRLILLQEEFGCSVSALAAVAMECVVREVAARLRLR